MLEYDENCKKYLANPEKTSLILKKLANPEKTSLILKKTSLILKKHR